MKVIFSVGTLPKKYKHVVAAIGVFDGVHLGHQRVINRAIEEARRMSGTSVVVTFYPHPVAVLHPKIFKGYLVSLEQRIKHIEDLGADVCYVIPFTKGFAGQSALEFEQLFLINKLRTQKVVVGVDFHFGSHRRGSARSLISFGLDLEKMPILKIGRSGVKTTFLKKLVAEGNLSRLKAFLGRDYAIWARVVRGEGVGRRFGFPTANLFQENVITLPTGIYAAHVIICGQRYCGVFYIGKRPTIKLHGGVLSLEAHVLDFKGNLYGQIIGVEVLKKLRDERIFPDEKSLVNAIALDVSKARAYFNKILP